MILAGVGKVGSCMYIMHWNEHITKVKSSGNGGLEGSFSLQWSDESSFYCTIDYFPYRRLARPRKFLLSECSQPPCWILLAQREFSSPSRSKYRQFRAGVHLNLTASKYSSSSSGSFDTRLVRFSDPPRMSEYTDYHRQCQSVPHSETGPQVTLLVWSRFSDHGEAKPTPR